MFTYTLLFCNYLKGISNPSSIFFQFQAGYNSCVVDEERPSMEVEDMFSRFQKYLTGVGGCRSDEIVKRRIRSVSKMLFFLF